MCDVESENRQQGQKVTMERVMTVSVSQREIRGQVHLKRLVSTC